MKTKVILFNLFCLFSIILIFISINNCSLCKDCGGNRLQPILDKLPYSNKGIVKFSNGVDTVKYTVSIGYNKPAEKYSCSGEDNTLVCDGELTIKIGDFRIMYLQRNYNELIGPICYCDGTDSLDYNYKGQIIKAYYYVLNDTTNKNYINVGFYVAKDNNRLLQYVIKRNGQLENWYEN